LYIDNNPVAVASITPWPAAITSKRAPRKSEGGYQTYVIRPAINKGAILEGQPLPAVCRDETIMKIMCARGEYEPASFLIRTDRPLKQVMVRVGRLKGKTGTLSPEAVDVRIARKFYRAITWRCRRYWSTIPPCGRSWTNRKSGLMN